MLGASGPHCRCHQSGGQEQKRSYWVNESTKADAEGWLAASEEKAGSWWHDWSDWLRQFADGECAAPQEAGFNAKFKAIEPAPGRYEGKGVGRKRRRGAGLQRSVEGENRHVEVALVTGEWGLGEAVCIKLAALGYKVTTHSPNNAKAKDWLTAMNAMGYGFRAFPAMSPTSMRARPALMRWYKWVGPVDVLVNNAGITRDMTFRRMTRRIGMPSFTQPRLGVQHDQAGDGRHGRAQVGQGDQRLVGQRSEGRLRADQLCRRQGWHARLYQGTGAGSRQRQGDGEYDFAGLHRHPDGDGDSAGHPRFEDSAADPGVPARQTGEIAGLVAYLASDEAAFVTGANISINGGQHVLSKAWRVC